jgi:DNA helicase-2/ATP-dependent DNA helicase PcrA
MQDFKEAYRELNANQKQAVDALTGPVMVIAGPGTGKTQVLALRIVNLIRKKKAQPSEILALTFTDSAASAMRQRISDFTGAVAYDISITTFHGFCNGVILENPELFLFAKDLRQLDELESLKLIKEILKKGKFLRLKNFFDPYYYQEDILKRIGELKRAGLVAEEFTVKINLIKKELEATQEINPRTGKPKGDWQKEWKNWEKLFDLSFIYQRYQDLCQKRGLYDFNDMILSVTEKLKTDLGLKREYQERFKYFLSDEYQDTNLLQNSVLEILGNRGKSAEIFVVGDDDQAIYGFQGANLENILSFKERHPGAQVIPITINYRSVGEVVALAEALIGNNQERITERLNGEIDKKITANAKENNQQAVLKYEFSDAATENYFLVEKIKKLIGDGIPAAKIAVLVRTNKQVSMLADIFIKSGIPVEISEASSILETRPIKELLLLLEAVANPLADSAVYAAMSLEIWEIVPADFFNFHHCSRLAKKSLGTLFLSFNDGSAKKEWRDFSKIERFFSVIFLLHKESIREPVLFLLEKVLNESGILDAYLKKKDIRSLNQLQTFFNFTKKFSKKDSEAKLKALLLDLKIIKEDQIKIKEQKLSMAEEDVRIMTVHRAKGLEFTAVFIPQLYSGNWGGRIERDNLKMPFPKLLGFMSRHFEFNKEESERRLFFVALTRARLRLFLSRASFPNSDDPEKEKTPSRFLEEIKEVPILIGDSERYEKSFEEKVKMVLKTPKDNKLSYFQKAEEKFLKERVKELSLSPTGLNLFLKCPQRYKYEKLLLIPKTKSKTLVLGTAVHQGLEDFFRLFGKRGTAEKSDLLEGFNRVLAKEILNKEDRESVKEEGEKILFSYYENYKDNLEKPLCLETRFNKVFLEGVLLTGQVDKIETIIGGKLKSANGNNKPLVRVVDYKTGKRYTKNAILGKTKLGNEGIYRQLVFYKLLSVLDTKFPFVVKEVQVDFVKPDNNKFYRESFEITEEEIKKLEILIKEVIGKIKRLEFSKTTDQKECEFCDNRNFCEIWEK